MYFCQTSDFTNLKSKLGQDVLEEQRLSTGVMMWVPSDSYCTDLARLAEWKIWLCICQWWQNELACSFLVIPFLLYLKQLRNSHSDLLLPEPLCMPSRVSGFLQRALIMIDWLLVLVNGDLGHSPVIIALGMLKQAGCPQGDQCGLLNETLSGNKQKRRMFPIPFQMGHLEGIMSESYMPATLYKQSGILREALGRFGVLNHRNRKKIGVELQRAVERWGTAACQGEEGLLQKGCPLAEVSLYTQMADTWDSLYYMPGYGMWVFLNVYRHPSMYLGMCVTIMCIHVRVIVHGWICSCVCVRMWAHTAYSLVLE